MNDDYQHITTCAFRYSTKNAIVGGGGGGIKGAGSSNDVGGERHYGGNGWWVVIQRKRAGPLYYTRTLYAKVDAANNVSGCGTTTFGRAHRCRR